MTHVRQEARLGVVGAAQMVCALVQFRVERDHAAIGVFQFAGEPREFFLTFLQFIERRSQLATLPLHFVERTSCARRNGLLGEHCSTFIDSERRLCRQVFHQRDDGVACHVVDRTRIHQPLSREYPERTRNLAAVGVFGAGRPF